MSSSPNKILLRMLDRLFASLANGPSLNARPHSSRQRVDLTQVAKFEDIAPEEVLRSLLGDSCGLTIKAKVPQPKIREDNAIERTPEEQAAQQRWSGQQALLHKLRIIAEDAKTYEQDTGVHVLNLGFPLLSLPPGAGSLRSSTPTRRVLAPIAFVPVSVVVKRGATQSVELLCKGDGTDRIVPNTALLAWLEQQTGQPAPEMFEDEEGSEPWREVWEIVAHVCKTMEIPVPDWATIAKPESQPTVENKPFSDRPQGGAFARQLLPAPRAEETEPKPTVLPIAILGLFPMANQGLLRDMQAMVAGEALAGPVESFIRAGVQLDVPIEPTATAQPVEPKRPRNVGDERLVAAADPCQSRAVKFARESKGLVVHGPPGTGKSQTITNIIGDHLSRDQRVLFVCDKRTALDVVANRLNHMGLGRLCAIVHDPQRDQRELYKTIREQLDVLPEAQTDERAEKKLAKVDEELQTLHGELTRHHEALMRRDATTGLSFHDLVGHWLALADVEVADGMNASLGELDAASHDLDDIFQRGQQVDYANNPWRKAAGIAVKDLVSRPMETFRSAMRSAAQAATEADATADPAIPPFHTSIDLSEQSRLRTDLIARIEKTLAIDSALLARWAGNAGASTQAADAARRARQKLRDAQPLLDAMRSASLDPELGLGVRASPPPVASLQQQLGDLARYLETATKWYAFLQFGRKSAAAAVLNRYGLTLSVDHARRAHTFLTALRARLVLADVLREIGSPAASALPDDESLDKAITSNAAAVELLAHVADQPALSPLLDQLTHVMRNPSSSSALLDGLRKSPARAAAIVKLHDSHKSSSLINPTYLADLDQRARAGATVAEEVTDLSNRLDTLEGVLRIGEGLQRLTPSLKSATEQLVLAGTDPETATKTLRRSVLASEISRRLSADPQLQNIDGQRMKSSFERYRKLEDQKKELVREAVLHRWITKQKSRLLAGTGSRLNSLGADLRRRLTLRGERAMRLRQVIAVGKSIDGGDPLFDLCPIWMASPETVAQIFPRQPLFDVVVFDEASQCRLEEALPVLTRGQRVVIAGDPKQLPPTRFFESAIAQSEDEEIETDQQLFELQQGEIEDLLGAALNLSIQQCYLDVHYRSRNSDLIEFSNEHFYGDRLQPIPGHPSRRAKFAPLTLYRADGVYADHTNEAEADKVVEIVRDLLKRAKPPSIGIACFNVDQRDLIVEKLDELAAEDSSFGKKLAEARTRVGAGSFEGLFVKNLENVQGDERDHMIISTTYGPDAKGRFYRRFGPLGRAGGGRRLNVLVTRAREEVHLVTSIPPGEYRALPPVPSGQTPGGGWLLFSYLAYAEQLAEQYSQAETEIEKEKSSPEAHARVLPSRYPSAFAQALGEQLAAQQRISSDVHWGNDGFSIDVALHHPQHADDVTVGVLCDTTRFAQADDPVEWDAFRTAIHETQGWQLHRLWTPHFFRDPQGVTNAILKDSAVIVEKTKDKDAIKTQG